MIRRAVSVVKRRSGPHEHTIRELTLGPHGIGVGEPLTAVAGGADGPPHVCRRPHRWSSREAAHAPPPATGVEEPVLILTPTGRDAAVASGVVARGRDTDAPLPRRGGGVRGDGHGRGGPPR